MSGHDINDLRDVQDKTQLVKIRMDRLDAIQKRALKVVMSTVEGRLWMHHLLVTVCKIDTFEFIRGGHEAEREQTLAMGRIAVGFEVQRSAKAAAPREFVALAAEAQQRLEEWEATLAAEDALFDEDGNRINDAQESAQPTEDGNG